MGITRLQAITNLGGNISEITIITKNKEIADAVKVRLARSINDPALDVMSWKDMAPNLVSAIKLMDQMLLIYYAIFFITVVFSIANTLIMSIMERFHEIGVMKSIGTRPSQVFFIVMFEALNLGAVGLATGLATGMSMVLVVFIYRNRLFSFRGCHAPVGRREYHLSFHDSEGFNHNSRGRRADDDNRGHIPGGQGRPDKTA